MSDTRSSPDIKEALHYLSAIKVRLELLYEHSTQDARLLEHLSDEVDWVDAEIERLRSTDAAATASSPIDAAWERINALGGTGSTSEDLAFIYGVDRALSVIEELGGMDPLRRQGATRQEPLAWIVKWSTKHTPKNASAYLNEADAKRTASNVKMYADASDVVVIPAFAAGDLAQPAPDCGDDESRMVKISVLIARLQSTLDQWGDTCVYIRRGGLSWGAVALNRQADDEKHGVFDLQAQHDRDMLERLGQVERLKKDRDEWRQKVWDAEAKASSIPSTEHK